MSHSQAGFTLIELLATISIACILMFSAGPLLSMVQDRQAVDSSELVNLLQEARKQAVYTESSMKVCPVNIADECANDWINKVVAFNDANNNDKIDADERVAYEFDNREAGLTIAWQSAADESYISFKDNGGVGENFGRLLLSKAGQNESEIVLPVTGHARIVEKS